MTHHNHDINLGLTRLQQDTQLKIAAQLRNGVSVDKIMDKIREDTTTGINRTFSDKARYLQHTKKIQH